MNKIEIENKTFYHPGYFLQDIMRRQDWDVRYLSSCLFMSQDELRKFLNGEIDFDEITYTYLENYTAISRYVWLNFQQTFNLARLMIEV